MARATHKEPSKEVSTDNHKVLCALINEALETISLRTLMLRSGLTYEKVIEACGVIAKGFPERRCGTRGTLSE